jgi:DNA-binding GntR family transcriptional regulator
LTERDLATRFKTTRITIRQFRKLGALGLVQTSPNLGARIADFSPVEIEKLYLVRIHLEMLAATFAIMGLLQRMKIWLPNRPRIIENVVQKNAPFSS